MRSKKININNNCFQIEFLNEKTFRFSEIKDDIDKGSLLNKYGFISEENLRTNIKVKFEDKKTFFLFQTACLQVKISKKDGCLTVSKGKKIILHQTSLFCSRKQGWQVEFNANKTTRFFGLGDQSRDRIEHSETKADLWVQNVKSYIPIPFFISNNYGLFLNSTFRVQGKFNNKSAGKYSVYAPGGNLDFYFFYGEEPKDIIGSYTLLTGRPKVPSKWSFGLWFLCNVEGSSQHKEDLASARDVINTCLNFRRENIPCDGMLLEPNWMSKWYDTSIDKDWCPERFYIPPWGSNDATFLGAMRRLGFKPGLWLCNQYDLTYEEERNSTEGKLPLTEDIPLNLADDIEKDEHFSCGLRQDQVTVPDEPWFRHLEKFIRQGVEVFKQDGCAVITEYPDRAWANGAADAEMHNIYALVCAKQMAEGYRKFTNRRSTFLIPGGWAGLQKWCGTWTGDTGGGPRSLTACLNLAMCGHSTTAMDMDVFDKKSIHAAFLMPWTHLNSWAYWKSPWLLDKKGKALFKEYDMLRYRMLAYIYSYAHQAANTGIPMMRPLPLAFPNDPKCENTPLQYMLGDEFLVCCFENKFYLPEGIWIDFWDLKEYQGGQTITYKIPENRGGALFVRAGSIIPWSKDREYIGENPPFSNKQQKYLDQASSPDGKHPNYPDSDTVKSLIDEKLTLEVFPGPNSTFEIFEDDGLTLDNEKGLFSKTCLKQSLRKNTLTLSIGERVGKYKYMPRLMEYDIKIHCPTPPSTILRNGKKMLKENQDFRYSNGILNLSLGKVKNSGETVVVIFT
jgi:alpha-glucosidase (family GH31 glycosyl hydrolase)